MSLRGRSLAALVDAESRIAEQYGVQPELFITNQPGVNAFAAEANGRSIVVVNADTVRELGEDSDLWGALFGHEFGHLHHHHSAIGQSRAAVINLVSTLLDAHQKKHGKDRTELINFGAGMVNNAFTRDQEREADATGLAYMVQAGFDPNGAIRLQELITKYGNSDILSFLQSHPSGEERVNNLRSQIAKLPADSYMSHEPSFSLDEFRRQVVLGIIKE